MTKLELNGKFIIKNEEPILLKLLSYFVTFVDGVYSGIPFCCIRHFCYLEWKYLTPTASLAHHFRTGYYDVNEGDRKVFADYVLCDKCYHNEHVVEIPKKGCPKIIKWMKKKVLGFRKKIMGYDPCKYPALYYERNKLTIYT